MSKRMVDSITPTDIPVNDPATGRPWDYVLGYVDGAFTWSAAGWARFPNSIHVRCAVRSSTLDADVLDRESGDATATQAVQWVQAKRARGDRTVCVYVGLAEWGALQAAFNAAGVAHPDYGVAAYPGAGAVQQTLNGITSVFHQCADPTYGPGGVGSGGHYDLSVVVDGWMGSTPLNITSRESDDMSVPFLTQGNWLVWVDLASGRIEDTQRQLTDSATYNGLPLGKLTGDREQALRAMNNRWDAIQNKLAAGTSVTIDTATFDVPPFPTKWTATDSGAGVTTIEAVTPPAGS